MSDYRNYIARELGIRESSIKPAHMDAADIDPKELEMGMEDEKEHTGDDQLAKTIALHHLKKHPDYYSKLKGAGLDEMDKQPSARDRMMSPTAIAPQIIGVAVRGSNTGGLPSGADQTGISPSTPTGRLGGYEPIDTAKNNSELVDKTPSNNTINSSVPIADEENVGDNGETHPHQVQNSQGEPPQAVTGAEEGDECDLTLKSAVPGGIDIDVAEGEDEENNSNNPEFQEKDKEQFRKDRSSSPEGDDVRDELGINEMSLKSLTPKKECSDCGCDKPHVSHDFKDEKENLQEQNQKVSTKLLQEVRQTLSEKAASGKMSTKESELFSTITEVLKRRGLGLEQKLFGKKTMLETANVKKKLNERQLPTEELAQIWADDKDGEYIQIDDNGSVRYIAHGMAKEIISNGETNDSVMFAAIRAWMKKKGFFPNIWHVNERGNLELYSSSGTPLGGLV